MTKQVASQTSLRRDADGQDWQVAADPVDSHNDILDLPPDDLDSFSEAVRPWRPAKALGHLLAQVNAAFPNRSRASDGIIGDPAHQSRASDHNPWVVNGASGVVTALDVTHDPAHGCDGNALSAALRAGHDKRIKYIIWNRRIANSAAIGSVPAWSWRTYTGKNPHNHHVHLSVKPDKALYDSEADWSFRQAEEAMSEFGDAEAEARFALEALCTTIDRDAPLLPQVLGLQDALTELIARTGREPMAEDGEEAPISFDALKAGYEKLFADAKVNPAHKGEVAWYLKRLRANRMRYEEVSAQTSAPWWFVGIVHAMEASFSFTGHLHNGDPLSARTVQIPAGRPRQWNPPSDWLSSAFDALEMKGFVGKTDWSVARSLFRFESYNGYGYHTKGINSPYLWSFSNQYAKGKYVRDGVFDPNAVSKQCGAAIMLRALVDSGEAAI